MANLSKDTLQKIREISFYNVHLKRSSAASKILVVLYPDKKYDTRQIAYETGLNNDTQRITLLRLVGGNLVKLEGDDRSKVYGLTQVGRWFAICSKLNLTFLSLCALADAYEMQTRLEGAGLTGFYVFPRFVEIFEDIYSQDSIRVALEQLKLKNLALRYTKKSLRLRPKVLENLKRCYQEDIEELQKWIARFQDKKEDLMRNDQNLIQNIRNNRKLVSGFA